MSIKRNLVYNIILSVSNLLFPIITFPYAARVLGATGIGTVNFAQSFCQYFIFFCNLGIPVYGVREIAKVRDDHEKLNRLFWELNIIRLVTTIMILIPYLITISVVGKFADNMNLYIWGALFILINTTSLEWFFSGLEDFKYIATRSILLRFISVAGLFLFVKNRSDVTPYFLITVVTSIFTGCVNIKHARKFISFKFIDFSKLNFRVHFKPLVIIFGGIFAINVYLLLSTIILGFLQSDKIVGLYSAASKLGKLGLGIITALGTVLVPRLAYALAKDDQESIDILLKKSFNFVFTFGVPIVLCIYVLAPEIMILFSGGEFLPSVPALRIMSPLIVIIGLANIFSVQILTPLAKDKHVMYAAVTGAIVSLALNFILIPVMAERGAAIAYCVAEIAVTIMTYRYAKRHMVFNIEIREFINAVLLSLLFIPVSMIFRNIFLNNALPVILFTVGISTFGYVAIQILVFKNKLLVHLLSIVINNYYIKRLLSR